jgi:hypothetical protein
LISYAVEKTLAGQVVATITVRSSQTKGMAIDENQDADGRNIDAENAI